MVPDQLPEISAASAAAAKMAQSTAVAKRIRRVMSAILAPGDADKLLDALEEGGAEIRTALGFDVQGDFVAFDDALAEEFGGSAVHIGHHEEGDLVAHNFAFAQRQRRALRMGHGARQFCTVLFEGKSEG